MENIIMGQDLERVRQKFVSNRFEEEQLFGRQDVRAWLEEQRKADVPDVGNLGIQSTKGEKKGWWRYLPLIHNPNIPVSFLTDGETIYSILKKMGCFAQTYTNTHVKNNVSFAKHVPLHMRLMGKSYPYAFLTTESILFFDKSEQEVLVVTPRMGKGGSYSTALLMQSVANSVLLSWLSQGEVPQGEWVVGGREKCSQAYLCDWLERCIDAVEREAKAEFDEAVAVIEDGKKIVSADYVVLYDSRQYLHRVYRAEEFGDIKLIRKPSMKKVSGTKGFREDGLSQSVEQHLLAVLRFANIPEGAKIAPSLFYKNHEQMHFTFLAQDGKEYTCFAAPFYDVFPEGGKLVMC